MVRPEYSPPTPLQVQGVPQEAVRRLQRRGGVPRVRSVRRGGVRGLQLRGGRGHGDTPHGDTAADSSFIPTSFRINNGFVLFAQGGKITKIADKLGVTLLKRYVEHILFKAARKGS